MPSPMIKATLAAAALSCTSNVLAQFLEAYRDARPLAFDFAAVLRFVAVTLIATPPNYMWQQLLERSFPAYERRVPSSATAGGRDLEKQKTPMMTDDAGEGSSSSSGVGGSSAEPPRLSWRNTLAKWFIDCITLGALFNTLAFFVLMGVLKRQPGQLIARNVRVETLPVIVAGYKIWPLASIVSFSCVPVERRIVFLNFIGLLWGIYMSLVASRV
ncbi:hypothetical protein GGR56DRAFT_297977 [Xylariaceae sp. FL0804]|nr:hypothetical protein GGR56DRAFT_297977 [Xylariaceae sp. FL0804]